MKLISVLRPMLELGAVLAALLLGLRLVTGLFGGRGRVYRPGFGRQLYLLFWPLLCLAVGLPFLGSLFVAESLSAYEWALVLLLGSVVVGFSGPALVLHLQYYVRNQHTALVFDPKRNLLEVYEAGQLIPFGKSDLVRVERVTCRSRRMFWSPYTYLRLHLRSGQVLTLTSLLINLDPLTEFLRNTPLERTTRWLCLL
ncbi:hypothetical protein [Hymenobacter weizhouensis]|uniref:hypothetical protein n=1 Tax=Hymenobacter sp. YIM 151500-1 TaxID=2987689 RepID=UPI002227618F|nr:hypothetical protein [Hymenobacter sp. YIM 151500-1]UYZ61860.1 hypothetical protein OIS53_12705 [Hymenobacter sp. YIM 151500-1]